jgi:hypothetical protein
MPKRADLSSLLNTFFEICLSRRMKRTRASDSGIPRRIGNPSDSRGELPGELRMTFTLGTRTPSPKLEKNAAGHQLHGHNSMLCADPQVHS